MGIAFSSKSARHFPQKVVKVNNRKVCLQDNILWYGKQDAFYECGQSFGYNLIDSFSDISQLLQMKALILREASLRPYIQQINFAVNYDIPVIWFHSHLIPHDWMWSFKFCCIGDIEKVNFWRHICELTG